MEMKQPTLENILGRPAKLGAERKGYIDNCLMKMIVGKVLPPSLVDNEFFREFVKALEPRYLY